MEESKGRKKKTTETSFEIIESLIDLDGANVTEIANEVNISVGTAHEHLSTLYDMGYLIKEDNVFYPALKFAQVGRNAKNWKDAYVIAEEYTTKLGEKLNWRSNFVVEEHGKGVFLHIYSGNQAEWEHEKVGNRQYMHNTATGKAILAHLDDEYREAVLDKWGLPKTTPNTITDRDELYDELADVRKKGYAVNHEENIEGIRTFAVPATTSSDKVLGSFSVTIPSHVAEEDWPTEEFKKDVLGTVNEYELELSLS